MADQGGYIELRARARADTDAIRERMLDAIRADLNVDPRPGDFLWHFADTVAEQAAAGEELLTEVGAELFEATGQVIYGVPALNARAAQGTTTWTLSGVVAGDRIEAGTPLATAGDVVLEVTDTITLTAGQTTAVGVPVAAVEEGQAGNDQSGLVELLRTMPFVVSVVLDEPTSLGRDQEDRGVYRTRLRGRVSHLGRPTLPADFADRARDQERAHRVLVIDNYIPADGATPAITNAERAITLVPIDEDGEGLTQLQRDEIAAAIEAEREPNWIVSVIEPAYTTIAVTATVTLWDGYDSTATLAAGEAALADFLSPATWGTPPNADAPAWHDQPVVRVDEARVALNNVEGVRYVQTLTLNGGTADIALPTPAGLPRAGVIDVTEAP
jgi:hypothetical protein